MSQYNRVLMLILLEMAAGIYGIYILFSTRKEMIASVADIPAYWLLIFLLVNIYTIYMSASMILSELKINTVK